MVRELNNVFITEDEARTCLLDGKQFPTSKFMLNHVKKTYNLNFEEYVIKCYYGGIRPVCLKSGNSLSFKASKLGPFFKNYAKNCFPRKSHTEETKLKIKAGCENTTLKKYGVKNVFTTDWCKEKIKSTNLEKYGVENPAQNPEFMKKKVQSFNETIQQRHLHCKSGEN